MKERGKRTYHSEEQLRDRCPWKYPSWDAEEMVTYSDIFFSRAMVRLDVFFFFCIHAQPC